MRVHTVFMCLHLKCQHESVCSSWNVNTERVKGEKSSRDVSQRKQPHFELKRDFFQFSFSMRVAAIGRRIQLLQLCFECMKYVA